jgi:tRNA(Arg) A34 adenosine deaminase TadA
MDETLMRRAIALSLADVQAGTGGPFGAVIARDGAVIAEGTNAVTSSNDPTAHAEIVTIREACRKLGSFQLTGCELYTSCEPCPMCLGAIYWARLDRIFYANGRADAAAIGFDDALIYSEISTPVELRKIPMRQLLRGEAQAAFTAWNNAQTKVAY